MTMPHGAYTPTHIPHPPLYISKTTPPPTSRPHPLPLLSLLLSKDDIRIVPLRFGEEQRANRAGEADAHENCESDKGAYVSRQVSSGVWIGVPRGYGWEGEGERGNDGERSVLYKTAGVPTESVSALKPSAEMIAPALPHAAEIPCAVAR